MFKILSTVFLILFSSPVLGGEVFKDCPNCSQVVSNSDGVALGRLEVTRSQYAAFIEASGYSVS